MLRYLCVVIIRESTCKMFQMLKYLCVVTYTIIIFLFNIVITLFFGA